MTRMTNSITFSALLAGLICSFTQVARGQQPGPVPPSARLSKGPAVPQEGHSESDVATANNPIAPMNALYFQNYYAPTVYSAPRSSNLLDFGPLQ